MRVFGVGVLWAAVSVRLWAGENPPSQNFRPGDILGMNGPSFTYALRSGGEANFVLPSGGRVQVLGKVGDGYLVRSLPHWKNSQGEIVKGTLIIADKNEMTLKEYVHDPKRKLLDDPNFEFIVYPSQNRDNQETLTLVERAIPPAAAQKVSLPSEVPDYDEASEIGHALEVVRPAPGFAQKIRKLQASKSLFVRGGPSQDFEVLANLSAGDTVEELTTQEGWSFVKVGPKFEGWIRSDLLEGRSPPSESTQPLPELPKDLSKCLKFDPAQYSAARVEAFTQTQRKNSDKIAKLKENFYRFFAPLAVHLAEVSGYPASVMMAQWLRETGWGRSRILSKAMNISGHSCFSYHENYESQKLSFSRSQKQVSIKVACMHKRPPQEKYWYRSYGSIIEAGYAYVYNLVESERSAEAYKSLRKALKSKVKLTVADRRERVIDGLKQYAFDKDYRDGLRNHIQSNALAKYDSMRICQ